jgi:hypothetical protein
VKINKIGGFITAITSLLRAGKRSADDKFPTDTADSPFKCASYGADLTRFVTYKFGASRFLLVGNGEALWSMTPLRSSAVPELASACFFARQPQSCWRFSQYKKHNLVARFLSSTTSHIPATTFRHGKSRLQRLLEYALQHRCRDNLQKASCKDAK